MLSLLSFGRVDLKAGCYKVSGPGKKNDIVSFAGKMDGAEGYHIETSHSHKDKCHMFSLICGSWEGIKHQRHESKKRGLGR
jgi:hypothetical protein